MTVTEALFLSIIQGLTEFLPVSSSGHLVLLQSFLGISEPPLFFDTLVHVGTLVSVIIYFRKQLREVWKNNLRHIVVGTIPAVLFGLFIYRNHQGIFSDLQLVSYGFLITSTLLILSTRFKNTRLSLKKLSLNSALIIGLFQAAAIIPGISRSGSTITAGLLTGLNPSAAFSFSFILSIPAIIGALTLNLADISSINPTLITPSLVGLVAAILTGLFSLKILNQVLKNKNFLPFAIYTFILGSLLFGLSH